MLSSETPHTLLVVNIVTVLILRSTQNFVIVKLPTYVEGMINTQYLTDQGTDPRDVVKNIRSITGVIIDVKMNLDNDSFSVELSARQGDVASGDSQFRRAKHDDYWNLTREERDSEMQARKKRAEVDKTRRVIKHPNFHNFNAAQAEAYLDKQQRGDVVIRPSSKGSNHLAVTWKVDDKLFQHIGTYINQSFW